MDGVSGSRFAVTAVLAAAALLGCTPQAAPISPEQRLAMIPTGEPLLTCRADCLAAWRTAEPQAEALAARHRWPDLALLVLRVNYDDDLTEYYLAEAAQGMGYREAAASYYRQSIALSGTSASCAASSGLCGGISLPRAASARLAALGRLSPRRVPIIPPEKPAPPMPAAPAAVEPPAAPAAVEPPAAPAAVAPPAAPAAVAPPAVPAAVAPPAAPALPVRAPSREEEQYIEPPPARP